MSRLLFRTQVLEDQRKHNLSSVFFSHDLLVVRAIAGDVVVQGGAPEIFRNPEQEYTRTLLKAAFGLAS